MSHTVHEMSSFKGHNEAFDTPNDAAPSKDTLELARAGKKQVLERRFGFISMTGFSCSLMCTWEGVLLYLAGSRESTASSLRADRHLHQLSKWLTKRRNFSLGLVNGGPGGLVWGYIITWLGSISVFIAMGELASMIPTAGGQYHWVSTLAPKRIRKFMSYVTGWSTVISWIAAATVISFYVATLIQTAIAVNTTYEPTRWQGTLLMWAILVLATVMTTIFGKVLPTLEIILLLLHVLGFFGTIIPLGYHARHRGSDRAHEIFTEFFNLGGWPTQTLSFFIGLQGNAASLLGTDGAVHMSEEVEHSTTNVPRSMIMSLLINGSTGFAVLLGSLFAVDSIEGLLEIESFYPFVDILTGSFQSKAGATVIVCLILFMNAAAAIGALSSAGRMSWSFARDYGLPGWQWLRKVDDRTSIPFNAIFVATVGACLIGLINVGSTVAFQDCISLVLVGFYTSYLLAISMLLYRRLRGDIVEPNDNYETTGEEQETFTWGPWRLKGWLGTANNIFAVVYLIIVTFFSFWPAIPAVNAMNMNYSSLVLGAVMIFSVVWYFVAARKIYTGPVVEVVVKRENGYSSKGAV